MAKLTHKDWREVNRKVSKDISQRGEPFVQGKVVKNDASKRVVWLKEFGPLPIPIFAFDYQVTIAGVKYTAKPVLPKVGETVLVAQYLGSSELPKCLGALHSTGFLVDFGD